MIIYAFHPVLQLILRKVLPLQRLSIRSFLTPPTSSRTFHSFICLEYSPFFTVCETRILHIPITVSYTWRAFIIALFALFIMHVFQSMFSFLYSIIHIISINIFNACISICNICIDFQLSCGYNKREDWYRQRCSRIYAECLFYIYGSQMEIRIPAAVCNLNSNFRTIQMIIQ